MDARTTMQENLVSEIIINSKRAKPIPSAHMMERAGYAKSTATYPGRIIKSPGVRQALQKKGFTIENAERVVTQILNKGKKEQDKLRAADMIFKAEGRYAPEKRLNLTINASKVRELSDEELAELAYNRQRDAPKEEDIDKNSRT